MAREPFYRTLRGLDPYSDRFCRLLIRRLTEGTVFASVTGVFITCVIALMLSAFWVAAGLLIGPAVGRMIMSGAVADVNGWRWRWAAAGVLGVVGFVVSFRVAHRGLVLTALRDALRPRVIDGEKCLVCGYSLAGLTGRASLIVCPECGRTVPIGLGAVDLIEHMMARGELPREGRFESGRENRAEFPTE